MDNEHKNTNKSIIQSKELDEAIINLPNIILDLQSNDLSKQYSACLTISRIIDYDTLTISNIIELGGIQSLVDILNPDSELSNSRIQYEAIQILTDITGASGVGISQKLLSSTKLCECILNRINSNTSNPMKREIFSIFGNIASDSPTLRDYLLKLDIINILLFEINSQVDTIVRHKCIWCISNICRTKPHPPFEYIKPIIYVLKDLLTDSDTQVITDTCWAISFFTDGMDDCINEILKPNIFPHIIELLNHSSYTIQTPVLRIIGNIVTGTEQQAQIGIDNGCLPALKRMIQTTSKNSIIREICWTISNIIAGTQQQLQHVFDNGIIDILIHYMSSNEVSIQKEAIWAISNATSSGNSEQINQLVLKGCVNPLCKILSDTDDIRVIAVALEGIENILRNGEIIMQQNRHTNNPYVIAIEQYNGLYNIQRLNNHTDINIYTRVRNITNDFFIED